MPALQNPKLTPSYDVAHISGLTDQEFLSFINTFFTDWDMQTGVTEFLILPIWATPYVWEALLLFYPINISLILSVWHGGLLQVEGQGLMANASCTILSIATFSSCTITKM